MQAFRAMFPDIGQNSEQTLRIDYHSADSWINFVSEKVIDRHSSYV